MTMEILRQLAASQLPVTFRTQDEIDRVMILEAAGLIVARMPHSPDNSAPSSARETAQVLAVTPKGREVLARNADFRDEPPVAGG
ncbi:hypothetical protein WKW80_14130 [Variovorax humicola]|uniref:Uncharacterized protein n=1 Tax=Variovorax humicola TaxID=1769758 RepID=A0ABU8W1M5_9BURK